MKYCSECKKIYKDNEVCECVNKNSWSTARMIDLDVEPVCKNCGSKERLKYHPPFKWITMERVEPAYCTCYECDEKARIAYEREEAMKYIIIDCDGESEFLDGKADVEEYFEKLSNDMDYESNLDGYLLLKLELVERDIKADDFKNPNNTHLVFWDYEIYRVEEVIEPSVEYDGDITINW